MLTITACLFTELHAQGLYKNTEENKNTSATTEYNPSILRAKPEPPIGPGESETDVVPVSGGLLLLASLAGARYAVHGARRKMRNN